MPLRYILFIVLISSPPWAHSEVLDKLPQTQTMWLVALIGVLFAFLCQRLHWAAYAAAITYPAAWFFYLLIDLHSFDLGPAIAAEAGNSYATNLYGAASTWFLGSLVCAIVGIKRVMKWRRSRSS